MDIAFKLILLKAHLFYRYHKYRLESTNNYKLHFFSYIKTEIINLYELLKFVQLTYYSMANSAIK